VLLAALLPTLAACTDVPSSSKPETIEHLSEQPRAAAPQPKPNAVPGEIVTEFLNANEADAASSNSRQASPWLTKAAVNTWNDTTAVILDSIQIGQWDPKTGEVPMSGRLLGTLSNTGVYTPNPNGSGGSAGITQSYIFKVSKTAVRCRGCAGLQYRISTVPSAGLILTAQAFQRIYYQRILYFYDAAQRYLVPDVRYSAEPDTAGSASWLLSALEQGPQQALQSGATSNVPAFPAQSNNPQGGAASRQQVTVTDTDISIPIPGASGLDGAFRNRLAAELAWTFAGVPALNGMALTIMDDRRAVTIPAAHGTRFIASDFSTALGPQAGRVPPPDVYYLRYGALLRGDGRRVAGLPGAGSYNLSSVAITPRRGPSALKIAGISGTGSSGRLFIGNENGLERVDAVSGTLSRPSWAPGRDELWVADGATLYCVTHTADAQTAVVQKVALNQSLPAKATIRAVRVSPDGTRVALVISSVAGSQAFVGMIVRGSGVRVDVMNPISPSGISITDVAWNDSVRLFLTGTVSSSDWRIVEVFSDGSGWSTQTAPDLPGPPDSITVAANQPAWVSVGSPAGPTLWVQDGTSWQSPSDAYQTAGGNPVYVE
jgi:hypothetical protein